MYQAAAVGAWQTTPLVVAHHVSHAAPNDVVALDAKTGACSDSTGTADARPDRLLRRNNRGLAILGDTLYMARLTHTWSRSTRKSGRPVWNTKVAEGKAGYSLTLAPLASRQIIVVRGGEYGIRGFVAAYDARSGGSWPSTRFPRRRTGGR